MARRPQLRVSRATIRRVTGATTSTVGKETAQEGAQAPSQSAGKPSVRPAARSVAMAETMADIRPDRIRPKRTGAKRAGIMAAFGSGAPPELAAPAARVNAAPRSPAMPPAQTAGAAR